jgi:multicomponent Na+:H+ antiporter subunit E
VNRNVRRVASRLLMGGWLLGVWLLLWGRIDALTVIGGAVVVAGAYAASRLPAVPLIRRIRPLRVVAVIVEFGWDLLVSSVVIGWHALYRPGRVRSAVLDVEMRSRSELILLGVTTSISLRPGTLLIDLNAERTVLRIHAMPVRGPKEAHATRAGVVRTEDRLMGAFVTWEDAPPEEDDDR